MNVGIAIGDEALHAVQTPRAVFFTIGGFEHHALQIRTGIGLCEIHRHRLACANTGDETGMLLLRSKLIERFDTVLERPNVDKTGIGSGHQLGTHRVRHDREVQPFVASRHGHAVQAGRHHGFKVALRARGITHTIAFVMWAFEIDPFGIVGDDCAGNVAHDIEGTIIIVHGIFETQRCRVVSFLFAKIAFLQFHNALHQGVAQFKAKFRMISIMICHLSV